jgi:hypothetical protein
MEKLNNLQAVTHNFGNWKLGSVNHKAHKEATQVSDAMHQVQMNYRVKIGQTNSISI